MARKPPVESDNDDLADEITRALLRVVNQMSRNRKHAFGTDTPVTPVEAETCFMIFRQDGITGAELSNILGVTRSATSQVISRLKQKGFVTETNDPVDAKRKHLHVTVAGETAANNATSYFEMMRKDLYQTSREELQSWLRFVVKLEEFHTSMQNLLDQAK